MAELKLRQRISPGTDFLMKFVAAGLDFIGLLLFETVVGGTIVGIIGDLVFFVWYLTKGISLWKGKSLKKAGVNFLVELIPLINDFYPGFTVFVWTNNKAIMKEDEEYNAKIKAEYEKEQGQIKVAAITRQNEYMQQKAMEASELKTLAGEIDKQTNQNQRIIKTINDIRPNEKKEPTRDRHYTPLDRTT